MSKMIYVLDEPDNCVECPIICNHIGILEQCPLKPMPERKEPSEFWDDSENGYVAGWNSCLEEIGGGDGSDD